MIGTINEDRTQRSDVTHPYGLPSVTFAKDKSILSRYCIYYFLLCRKGQPIFMYVSVLTLLFSDTELLKPGNNEKILTLCIAPFLLKKKTWNGNLFHKQGIMLIEEM